MRFRVQIIPRAERDLDRIYGWLAKHSQQGAMTWHLRWLEVVGHLEQYADQAPFAPENPDHQEQIRHYIFKTRRGCRYRVLFTINRTTAYLLHIRGPGQQLVSKESFRLPHGFE